MSAIKDVRAEPGGRVELSFTARGYLARRETLSDVLERWGERLFGERNGWIALVAAIVLSLAAAPVVKSGGASETVKLAALAPALLCIAYLLLFVLVRAVAEAVFWVVGAVLLVALFPLLLSRRYRRRFFRGSGPLEARPGWVDAARIGQAWVAARGDEVTVTIRFVDGAHVRFAARGDAGRHLGTGFHGLLGPRLIAAH